jgi:hypothetical protein
MLRSTERGVGTCTDVALYAMHAGGRILPFPRDWKRYDAACGARTARLQHETMYKEFLTRQAGVLHMQLLNSEHMWTADEAQHARIGLFLCKTRFCAMLVRAHVAEKKWGADVIMMGHSSSDPTVDLPPGVSREQVRGLAVPGGQEQ